MKKDVKALQASKDEFSEWFTQIMLKADLADYTDVSGMIAFKPAAYAIWEKIVEEVDKRFKKLGVQNVYFPLFIPEKSLKKEQDHVEGFSPEVAWVTHAGKTKLNERLAVRPTSETIMYESYSKWIRSWRDLPLKYNQWNSVVRWEFKHPVPFLRTREFLWNEGHSAYASEKEAYAEKDKILNVYKEVCEEFLALPGLMGRKTDKEKFAGALESHSIEYLMPHGKAIQGPDWHFDGENFAKAYGIEFLDKDGKKKYVWQNTYALSTRMLGIMFAVHSDEKGLVLPPKVVRNKAVIVPILFDDSRDKVLRAGKEIKKKLGKYNVMLDDRDYKPGFKFNEWELKGIPIRIEVGPKDLAKKEVVLVRRDTCKKEKVKLKDLDRKLSDVLEDMQKKMFEKAKRFLKGSVVACSSLSEVKKAVDSKKIALTPLCKGEDDNLKAETGAKVLNIPYKQPSKKGKSVVSKKEADYLAHVARSY